MKLVKVTITNYRSIIKAYNLNIANFTVLVGPNNEGKSNILKAVNLALDILSNWNKKRQILSRVYRRSYFREERIDYDWNRDFPINIQADKPDGRSTITIEFELNGSELAEFQSATGINLSTNLKIKMGFGINDVSYDILMKGRGKKSLNSKKNEISEFIQEKLVYQYISAIRPSSYAKNIVERVLDVEIGKLEDNTEYRAALKQIENIQRPVFEELGSKISESIRKYIPSVQSVSIRQSENYRRYMRRECEIFVDDGTNTELSLKGDGIVSLASISLVQHFNSELAKTRSLIFAIEEPESHLHPDSINELKNVLTAIASDSQVIISTHSPILVDRVSIDNNIIVNSGKATKPRSISEVRDTLGIRLSDNLTNAQMALLVEGDADKLILSGLLPKASTTIKSALEKGVLIIDGIGGCSKLTYYAQFYKQSLTNIHVYFDNDEEGRRNIDKALNKAMIADSEYNLVNCKGMHDSEIEDMFKLDSYGEVIANAFGVSLDVCSFKTNQKWSDRVKQVFLDAGKMWHERTEKKAKLIVAESIASTGLGSLIEQKRSSFDGLVSALNSRLDEL